MARFTRGMTISPELNTARQEMAQRKEEYKEIRQKIGELRQSVKNETDEVSYRIKERSQIYGKLEEQHNFLVYRNIYDQEVVEIRALMLDTRESLYVQTNNRLLQITERILMLETKISGLENKNAEIEKAIVQFDIVNTRALAIRAISALIMILITIFHAAFFLSVTVKDIISPFVRSPSRIVISGCICVVIGVTYCCRDQVLGLYLTKRSKPIQ